MKYHIVGRLTTLSPALDCFDFCLLREFSKLWASVWVSVGSSYNSQQFPSKTIRLLGQQCFYLCSCSVYSVLSNSKSPRTVQSSNPRDMEVFLKFTFIKCVFDSNLGIFESKTFWVVSFSCTCTIVQVQYIINSRRRRSPTPSSTALAIFEARIQE